MIKKFYKRLAAWCETNGTSQRIKPKIIPRSSHTVSRSHISGYALQVMRKLHKEGFDAYLVGGCVRDLLLGHHPKDFDVVTNARPREIKHLFRNSYLIGKRFRLAHVRFGNEVIEVATYRSAKVIENSNDLHHSQDGMILRDNVFGTMMEDAFRRDFTINALYYNFADSSIVDYVDGVADIHAKLVRSIGDPVVRFREDPLRMIRALRFVAKLGCRLDKKVEQSIYELKDLLPQIPTARLFDEVMKIYRSGYTANMFELLQEYHILELIFPEVVASFMGATAKKAKAFVKLSLHNTDKRFKEGKSLNPAFLFVTLLWWPLQQRLANYRAKGEKLFPALFQAMNDVLEEQMGFTYIPKRFTNMVREIWVLQYQLPQRRSKRVYRCYFHPRFRAAYDFLLLRAEAEKDNKKLREVADWWSEFQHADEQKRDSLLSKIR